GRIVHSGMDRRRIGVTRSAVKTYLHFAIHIEPFAPTHVATSLRLAHRGALAQNEPQGGRRMEFFQSAPALGNTYQRDDLLRSLVRRSLPETVRRDIEPDLERLGQRAMTDLARLGDAAEAEPPRLVQFDPWGRRID